MRFKRCLLTAIREGMMKTNFRLFAVFALYTGLIVANGVAKAQERGLTVTVEAKSRSYHNDFVFVKFPLTTLSGTSAARDDARRNLLNGYLMLIPVNGGVGLKAQAEADEKTATLAFVLDDLPKGSKRSYRINHIVFIKAPGQQVAVEKKGAGVEITMDRKLFTRYSPDLAPNKPIFYPVISPEGDALTRGLPTDKNGIPGASVDHPHHRGLWFTHGSLNGVDFWGEGKGSGKTVCLGVEATQSGWVYGSFRTKTEWRASGAGVENSDANKKRSGEETIEPGSGVVIARDVRNIRMALLPNGDRLMDFNIEIEPVGKALTFGDTKEGTFGLRVPDAISVAPDKSSKIKPAGHIESSTGASDGDVWGKPAEWLDFWGTLNGKNQGVAIFDSPSNLRHPQTWHARTYGLFAVNPFGLHDFKGVKGSEGELVVPPGKTLKLSYRLIFHRGDTAFAHIQESYASFADPPKVEVK